MSEPRYKTPSSFVCDDVTYRAVSQPGGSSVTSETQRREHVARTTQRIVSCLHALSGVRNPEAVGRLLVTVREHRRADEPTGTQCRCNLCTAFRSVEIETKP